MTSHFEEEEEGEWFSLRATRRPPGLHTDASIHF